MALITLLSALLAAPPAKDASERDLELLQGDWAVVTLTYNGQALGDDVAQVLFRTIKGNEFTTFQFDKPLGKGSLKLDANKSLKTIDEQSAREGSKPRLGIYELEGDRLRICMGAPGTDRPKEFASKPDSEISLTVWERQKK
jgi:uncharacterized protein (TIGR03067 family)